MNIAEDWNIEKKMKKRKAASLLVKMLDQNNTDLLIIALVFLKKLSVFAENKDEMYQENIIPKLGRFLN